MATAMVFYLIFFSVYLPSLNGIARGDYLPFDYFKFVLHWPPALCNRHSERPCAMSPIPDDFAIHGLWPDVVSGQFPMNCPGVEYEVIEDEELLTALNEYWPNIVYGVNDNQRNWMYQWNRHGKCSLIWFFQLSYFDLAVEMKEKFDVLGHLVLHNISPGAFYSPQDIRTVLSWLTGKVSSLHCTFDNEGRMQLTEIRICYTPNGAIIDCFPGRMTASCNDATIFFPE